MVETKLIMGITLLKLFTLKMSIVYTYLSGTCYQIFIKINYTIESGVMSEIYIEFNETISYDNLPEVLQFYLTSDENF